jgi:galactonate dehydratase
MYAMKLFAGVCLSAEGYGEVETTRETRSRLPLPVICSGIMKRRTFFTAGLAAAGAGLAGLREARAQSPGVPKFKIREVRAVRLRGMVTKYVRVYTDQGLTGTGEMVDTVGAEFIVNEHLGPSLKGRDPLDIEAIFYDYFTWKTPTGGIPPVFMRGMGGPYLTALSGIDIALWDLAGKALGVPVHRLFGGKIRDKLAVYHHAGSPQSAKNMIARTGVRALKATIDTVAQSDNATLGWDPTKLYAFTLNNQQIDSIAKFVGSMREAVGPNIGLALEMHARLDTESAIQVAKAVAPMRPMWFEEPVPPDNVEAMVKVREASPVPIAAGENLYTRYGFRPYLEKQALSIIQPDMAKCGGLLETRKIASLAEIYHVPISPHGVASTLGKMAFAHVCSTVPNFMILEWAFRDPLNRLTDAADMKDGFLSLPDKPGIGIEINDDAVKEVLDPASKPL